MWWQSRSQGLCLSADLSPLPNSIYQATSVQSNLSGKLSKQNLNSDFWNKALPFRLKLTSGLPFPVIAGIQLRGPGSTSGSREAQCTLAYHLDTLQGEPRNSCSVFKIQQYVRLLRSSGFSSPRRVSYGLAHKSCDDRLSIRERDE